MLSLNKDLQLWHLQPPEHLSPSVWGILFPSQSGDIRRGAVKRCIAQYALNLFCITEQGENIGGGEGREMSGKREGCRGDSPIFCSAVLYRWDTEREKLHELSIGDYS